MKKFYSFAVAALAALSMNANLYVCGDGSNMTWDMPGVEVSPNAAGLYVFDLEGVYSWKMANLDAAPASWDDFNAGALFTETDLSADKVYPNGETQPLVTREDPNGNQLMPYSGNYTVTVDLNAMTVNIKATTAAPTVAPAVYIRGGMVDGWPAVEEWQFKNVSYAGGPGVWEFWCEGETEIEGSVEFKFADANWGAVNYGGPTAITPDSDPEEGWQALDYNGGNMSMKSNFEGKITFEIMPGNTARALFDDEAGVKNVEIDNNAPVEYFNLQGVRVENPENGLFIARQGKVVKKVVK